MYSPAKLLLSHTIRGDGVIRWPLSMDELGRIGM